MIFFKKFWSFSSALLVVLVFLQCVQFPLVTSAKYETVYFCTSRRGLPQVAVPGCHDLPPGFAGLIRNLYTSTCIDIYSKNGCQGAMHRVLSHVGFLGIQWTERMYSWQPCVDNLDNPFAESRK